DPGVELVVRENRTARARTSDTTAIRRAIMIGYSQVVKLLTAAGMLGAVFGTAPVFGKECYAPDTRAQERAFSRAVTTDGGKVLWLGGQTGSPQLNFEGQVRAIFDS